MYSRPLYSVVISVQQAAVQCSDQCTAAVGLVKISCSVQQATVQCRAAVGLGRISCLRGPVPPLSWGQGPLWAYAALLLYSQNVQCTVLNVHWADAALLLFKTFDSLFDTLLDTQHSTAH